MAYTTINKSTDYFNTKLYTGNGSNGHAITGVGFQPDLTWIKSRATGFDHPLFDSVRGATKMLNPNQNYAESTHTNSLTSLDSDGFTTDSYVATNNNSEGFVSWNWKANGAGSANTDGSINSTATSANTTAGFSIVKYTGTEANATVGHGLGVAPKMIIFKNTATTANWKVYHVGIGATKWLKLDTTDAAGTASGNFNNTEPTSSVFSLGDDAGTNGNGNATIAYCFAEKTGYSKFGSYLGNGNDDGPFVYTGFKPAFLLFKETSAGTNDSWFILDNKRNTYNPESKNLRPNNSDAEADSSWMKVDFLSNGFKLKDDDASINESGKNYIYMAFGQSLVGSNNVPCTAR